MVDALIWSREMSVGNSDIDFQHRKIIDAANMVRHLDGVDDIDILIAAADDLSDYTLKHFAFEEAALQGCGFAGFDDHKAQHDAIRECVDTITRNKTLVTTRMLDDVMSSIVHHILNDDREYAGQI